MSAPKARVIRLRVAWGVTGNYRKYDAYVLNSVFAAFRTDDADRWRVTHRRTGYLVGRTLTFKAARKLADALVRVTSASSWRFDDMSKVYDTPKYRENIAVWRSVSEKHGAYM